MVKGPHHENRVLGAGYIVYDRLSATAQKYTQAYDRDGHTCPADQGLNSRRRHSSGSSTQGLGLGFRV